MDLKRSTSIVSEHESRLTDYETERSLNECALCAVAHMAHCWRLLVSYTMA